MKRTILLAMLLAVNSASVFSNKFYDSKSQIIGISGNVEALVNGGFSAKYFTNDVVLPAEAIEQGKDYNKTELIKAFARERTGKKILDMLFQFNGDSLSEGLLMERAMQNVQLMDEERASIGVIDKSTILKEDYLPILENNYIFLTRTVNIGKSMLQAFLQDDDNANQRSQGYQSQRRNMYQPRRNYSNTPKTEKKENTLGKGDRYMTYWIIFKVGIDKNILDQVFACWKDMSRYNQIDVPIEYVASGRFKETDAKRNEVRNLLARSVSRKVETFAIRGQVTDNHPLTTNIGFNQGIKQGDRMNIYRQVANDAGRLSSIKVATARAGDVAPATTRLYGVSGGAASYKKGDIAVLRMDRGIGHSITYNYLSMEYDTKYHGAMYTFDKRLTFNRYGMATYLLASIGLFANKEEKFGVAVSGGGIEYYDTPSLLEPGIGIGIGKTFFNRVELMPYLKLHYMFSLGDEEEYEDFSQAVRLPVGIRANVNIFYPLQFTCGAEYNFMLLKEAGNSWGDSDASLYNAVGLFAGLRVVF